MRLLGAGPIWFGVLFHPYFPVYWLLMAIFGFVMHPVGATWRDKAVGFLRHCDPLLAIPAALACLMLAKLTWLSGASRLDLDPFQWIRAEGLFRTFIVLTHFQFLGKGNLVPLLALGLGLLGLLDPSVRNSQSFRRIGQPLVLLALALSMSAVLSVISYRRGYWILPRQWVASDALCCLAVVWCAKEFADWLKPLGRYADLAVVALLAWTPVLEAPDIYREKAGDVSTLAKAVFHPPKRAAPVAAPPIDKLPADNDAWVTLANENIAAGGPVWPVFRRFYQKN
jgi:hypothetical protein